MAKEYKQIFNLDISQLVGFEEIIPPDPLYRYSYSFSPPASRTLIVRSLRDIANKIEQEEKEEYERKVLRGYSG